MCNIYVTYNVYIYIHICTCMLISALLPIGERRGCLIVVEHSRTTKLSNQLTSKRLVNFKMKSIKHCSVACDNTV